MKNEDAVKILEVGPEESLQLWHRENEADGDPEGRVVLLRDWVECWNTISGGNNLRVAEEEEPSRNETVFTRSVCSGSVKTWA